MTLGVSTALQGATFFETARAGDSEFEIGNLGQLVAAIVVEGKTSPQAERIVGRKAPDNSNKLARPWPGVSAAMGK